MSKLSGLRDKDFLEQIMLLNDIAANTPADELDALIALFRDPVGDASVDSMVVIALNALLSKNEEYVVQCVDSDDLALYSC